MSEKKRWQPGDSSTSGEKGDRYPTPATAMSRAALAMQQADAALAAAGIHGTAEYGPVAQAMREAERQERKAMARAQEDVDRAMARAGRSDHDGKRATRHAGEEVDRAIRRADRAEDDAE